MCAQVVLDLRGGLKLAITMEKRKSDTLTKYNDISVLLPPTRPALPVVYFFYSVPWPYNRSDTSRIDMPRDPKANFDYPPVPSAVALTRGCRPHPAP